MKTINLAYPERSEIKYKAIRFPDGQQSIEIEPETGSLPANTNISMLSRLNTFLDLELIICATVALRYMGFESISLSVPYLLGARSDRRFSSYSPSYLVEVVAPILNSMNFDRVCCIDVHSHVAAACIKKLRPYFNAIFAYGILEHKTNYVLVAPDKGAYERVAMVAKELSYNKEIIVCDKHREIATGKIISTDVGDVVDLQGEDVYIVDDICDGGRTFIEIAKKLSLLNPGAMYLIVTHGIFSAGYPELARYFNRIYCTNSISDIDYPLIKQIPII